MINTIKWEALKRFHQIKWGIAICAIMLLPMWLVPVGYNNDLTQFTNTFGSLTSIAGMLFFCLIYPAAIMFLDYIYPYQLMELSTGNCYLKILIAKLLMNICSFLIGTGILYLLSVGASRFNTDHIKYWYFTSPVPYPILLYSCAIFIPIIISFCFMLCCSVNGLNNHRFLGTSMMSIIIILGVYKLVNILPGIVMFTVSVIALIAAATGSCYLAEKKYEPNI